MPTIDLLVDHIISRCLVQRRQVAPARRRKSVNPPCTYVYTNATGSSLSGMYLCSFIILDTWFSKSVGTGFITEWNQAWTAASVIFFCSCDVGYFFSQNQVVRLSAIMHSLIDATFSLSQGAGLALMLSMVWVDSSCCSWYLKTSCRVPLRSICCFTSLTSESLVVILYFPTTSLVSRFQSALLTFWRIVEQFLERLNHCCWRNRHRWWAQRLRRTQSSRSVPGVWAKRLEHGIYIYDNGQGQTESTILKFVTTQFGFQV